mgnify:CR=1 FL=1
MTSCYLMQNKIVLYTSIFGGYDGLLPQPELKGIDRICFTDRPLQSRSWEVIQVKPVSSDPVRNSRFPKILPHRFLSNYDISIYIDGNYLVVGDLHQLIERYLLKSNIAIFDHNQTTGDRRNCLYKEFDALIEMGKTGKFKDDPKIMHQQIQRYKDEGYPSDNGLIFGAAILRRHNSPDVIEAMETWWMELENGSRRDQLSFNYAAWKVNLNYAFVDGDLRNNQWFYMIGIHRKDYFWKLFRYRLRRMLGIKKHDQIH